MGVLSHSVQTLPIFHNLAIFICHLFIDGHFREGNILYDPKVFNDRLLVEIESVCPSQIPWQPNDITQSHLVHRRISERTDHILQLIFFDSNNLMEDIEQYGEHLTYYRIFVFSSFDDIDLKLPQFTQLKRISSANTLIARHNSKLDVIYIDWMSENGNIFEISTIYHCYECEKTSWPFYEGTFGNYEREKSISMKVISMFRQHGNSINYNDYGSIVPISGHMYLANLYNFKLNGSYVNMTCTSIDGNSSSQHFVVTHKRRKYYNEILMAYEKIKDGNM